MHSDQGLARFRLPGLVRDEPVLARSLDHDGGAHWVLPGPGSEVASFARRAGRATAMGVPPRELGFERGGA
ncbi:hypothetical protein GCM10018780_11620 [Streptomyces lanatus]|nr:hypothetical protein GCM10018780_11620 [Streptomyces lanatus]